MSDTPTSVLNHINLVVRDMPRSVAFYRRLGLAVDEATDPAWARHHATAIMPGGIRLELDSAAFARQWNPGWRGEPGRAGCMLFVSVAAPAEVDRLFERMTGAGYAPQKSPEDAF